MPARNRSSGPPPEPPPPRQAQLSFDMRRPPGPPGPTSAPPEPGRQEGALPAPRPPLSAHPPRPPSDLWQPGEPIWDEEPLFHEPGTLSGSEVPGAIEPDEAAGGDAPSGGPAATGAAARPALLAPPPRLREGPEARREPRIFGVGELLRAARLTLESRFADVRVEGEVSGLKRSGPGHLYFCLKDREGSIDCVMFSREALRLGWKVTDGQLVRCRGRLTIYEGRGKFQMTVTALEPAGAGLLAVAFEELKRKLAGEGLFAPERKRRLPFYPRRLGVVTSHSGAVIRDIIRVAHRRAAIPILLSPTPVQGPGAAQSIVRALQAVAAVPDVDLVIVARGGGSMEDLWCFNDEGLARAIAACRVPVISAVGHETDFTIADFVADLRAPTPSAAAELAVPVAEELRAELSGLARRAGRAMAAEIRGCRLALERARARLGDPRRLVDERRQLLDDLAARGARALRGLISRRRAGLRAEEGRLFRAHPQRRIAEQRKSLLGLEHRLVAAMRARTGQRRRLLEALAAKVGSLSPLGVLERGYSLARRPDGHVITQASELAPGDALELRFRDGEVRARVERDPESSS